jgi:hypothetical protein
MLFGFPEHIAPDQKYTSIDTAWEHFGMGIPGDRILNYSCMYTDGEMINESSGFSKSVVITFALNQNSSDDNSFYSDSWNISLPMKIHVH